MIHVKSVRPAARMITHGFSGVQFCDPGAAKICQSAPSRLPGRVHVERPCTYWLWHGFGVYTINDQIEAQRFSFPREKCTARPSSLAPSQQTAFRLPVVVHAKAR